MTPEELSKLPHYDYYTNMKEEHPDASDQLCRAFADAMKGYLYGTQEALDAFAWFWKGWAASSGARMRAQPEAAAASGIVVSPALLDVLVCVAQGQRKDRALSGTALHYLAEAEALLSPQPTTESPCSTKNN